MKNIGSIIKYKYGVLTNKYHTQTKGDTSCFRYPHLLEYYQNFDTDLKNDIFLLVRNQEETLFEFGKENIDILSNMGKNAYFAYIFNVLNVPLTEEEKFLAYQDIKKEYKKKSFKHKLKGDYHIIDFNKVKINESYQELENYIKRSKNYNTIVYRVKENNYKDIAVSMHGTNILYIDHNDYNYGIGLIKAIINNENGIKGKHLQNLKIEETYAKVPYMALYNYIKEPNQLSPDKTFMIAYLALAFQDKNILYSGLYAFLEPFMKLLFSCINLHDLLEYVINDNETLLKEHFNQRYENFYDKIYHEKNVFKRIDIIKEMALCFNYNPIDLYKILFNKEHILNTNIDYHVIAFIYLSKVHQDKELIFDLISNCYPWSSENKQIITLENWSKHVLLKYGEKKYNMLKKEYKKVANILEKL